MQSNQMQLSAYPRACAGGDSSGQPLACTVCLKPISAVAGTQFFLGQSFLCRSCACSGSLIEFLRGLG